MIFGSLRICVSSHLFVLLGDFVPVIWLIYGIISNFIGILTDIDSFACFSYFRRPVI